MSESVKALSMRQYIANQIKADNPTYIVKSYPASSPDNLSRTAQVAVFRTELTNAANILNTEVRIELMIGKDDEDFLEEVLDEVLLSIQRLDGVNWTTASRTMFDDQYNGYQILVTSKTSNTYKEIIASEGAI